MTFLGGMGGGPRRDPALGRDSRIMSRPPSAAELRALQNGGGSPAPTPAAPPPPSTPPRLGGGGGGGGGAAPTPRPPVQSLEDFIQNHILMKQGQAEQSRMVDDFDAETMRMTQETEADQAVREQDLGSYLDDAGLDNAGSFASRGLERSGLMFQGQERINEEGVRRQSLIEELMTNLVGERGRGRNETVNRGQGLINDRIAQLTGMFNGQNNAQIQ